MSISIALHAKLTLGLADMCIQLSQSQEKALVDYVLLIHKWNKVHNLTAIRDPLDMVTLHVLDSLSVLNHVKALNPKQLLDVGAGAGLPSIPLAICLPDLHITAIDAVQKKTSFMRQVKGELNLNNFSVATGRVEVLSPAPQFDIVISRAFSSIALFVKLTKHLLVSQGQWFAMKGLVPTQELTEANIATFTVEPLSVTGLGAERHLIIIPRNSVND